METIDKLKEIAQKRGQLSERGDVKHFSANEGKGYFLAIKVRSGCSVGLHCTKDDRLTLDLKVTKTALDQGYDQVARAVEQFNEFFDHKTKAYIWRHALTEGDTRFTYGIDVTHLSSSTILSLISDLERFLSR